MVSPFDVALLVAYTLLVVGIAVQYRRGALDRQRLTLLIGLSFTWLAYALVGVSGAAVVGTVLNVVAAGLVVVGVVTLVVGLRRYRDADRASAARPD
jgi:zinc transporter ZupT